MKLLIVSLFMLSGCFLDHPQYCRSHDDCLTGQHCPTIRSAANPPDVCKGKAIITPMKLGD